MKITKIEKTVSGIILVIVLLLSFGVYKCSKAYSKINKTVDKVNGTIDNVEGVNEAIKKNGGWKQLIIDAGKEVKDIKKQINEADSVK